MDNIYKSGIDAIDELTIKIHDPSISKIYRDELAELRDFRIRDIFKYDNNSSWYEPKLWRLVFEKLDGLKLPTIFWGEYYNSLPNNWSLELLRFTHLSLDYDGFIIYLKKDNKIYFKNSESYYTSSLFDQYNHLLPNTKGGGISPK